MYRSSLNIILIYMFTVSAVSASDEECLYDQSTIKKENQRLHGKYPESQFLEEKGLIIIPVENGIVSLRKGGCAHYGMTVEMRVSGLKYALDEKKLFEKVMYLVSKYASELVEKDAISDLVKNRKWLDASDGGRLYYFLRYKKYQSFEVYGRTDGEDQIVGFMFYN